MSCTDHSVYPHVNFVRCNGSLVCKIRKYGVRVFNPRFIVTTPNSIQCCSPLGSFDVTGDRRFINCKIRSVSSGNYYCCYQHILCSLFISLKKYFALTILSQHVCFCQATLSQITICHPMLFCFIKTSKVIFYSSKKHPIHLFLLDRKNQEVDFP